MNCWLAILLCSLTLISYAQNSVNIGDPAPPLRLGKWIKGTPFQQFEKGHVYVLEFWATWCRPCKAAMPHLSGLARKYKDKVTVLGIDIYEQQNTSMIKIKVFVDSMGLQMDYNVATQEGNLMESGWIEAAGEKNQGIPRSFVVDAEGRLSWIGHPKDLAEVLPQIIDKTWDIKKALASHNLNRNIEFLDMEAYYDLYPYKDNPLKPGDLGQPDSALFKIGEMIKKNPELQYAPHIAYVTFSSLLKTNMENAYQYGKALMETSSYNEPAYSSIYNVIESYSALLNILPKIYRLGAEAYQAEIDQKPYPEIANIPKMYHNMAAFYWRANDTTKAIDAEQKAIEILKNKHEFSKKDLAAYEKQLQQYREK